MKLLFYILVILCIWSSKLHFSFALPENIVFPMDEKSFSINSKGEQLYINNHVVLSSLISDKGGKYYLQSCRYTPGNSAIYCEIHNTPIACGRFEYRLKLFVNNSGGIENINENDLEKHDDGYYYFKQVEIDEEVYSFSIFKSFEGIKETEDSIKFYTSSNKEIKMDYNKIQVYKPYNNNEDGKCGPTHTQPSTQPSEQPPKHNYSSEDLPVSTERCGKDYNTRCKEGYCCSKYGWCGKSSDHCGTGCQSDYGECK